MAHATNATLRVAVEGASSAGDYVLVVSNSLGRTTSEPATLIVDSMIQPVKITLVARLQERDLLIESESLPKGDYLLEATSDFESWTLLGRHRVESGIFRITSPEAVVWPMRFYRLRPQP